MSFRMTDHIRGINDFLSPLPQSPVPLEILERAESENVRVGAIVPLSKRYQGIQALIYDFIVTHDGTTYGLLLEDDEWTVIVTSNEVDDVRLAMEQYLREHDDERNVDVSWVQDKE